MELLADLIDAIIKIASLDMLLGIGAGSSAYKLVTTQRHEACRY